TVTGINLSQEPAMGMWFGRAVPDDPTTATFSELFIEPTFLDDGNVIFDSSQEERASISAGHGQWTVEGSTVKSKFLWMGMTSEGTSGFTGATKVRFTGQLVGDNDMTGSFTLVHFPPTADPLDPNDVGGTAGGTYSLQSLQRHRVGPTGPRNLSDHPAQGTWVGRAVPDDPSLSPFPEVYMTPTFHSDGNMIANDAIATSLHHTAHGDWFSTGPNSAETTFLFILGTPEAPNGFAGAFKIRLVGEIDPTNPDLMVGQLFPTLYPPDVNPLDPNAQGQPIVSLSFQLRRVPVQQHVVAFQPSASVLARQAHLVAKVTQNGEPAAGLEVAFARSIAGLPMDYKWKGTTDINGQLKIKIGADPLRRSAASGYYKIKATNASGVVISTWGSVPINGGREVSVMLPVGEKALVTDQIDLADLGVFSLTGNSPNPFNPATQIAYELNLDSDMRLVIFNHLGQEVRVLVQGVQSAGQYRVEWDGKDALGREVASGLYIYRLSNGQVSQTRQMLLLK
ncbi:MAG: T9SS type A sorting domain-containing protein, partial [Candidatus Latescibacteria bacterium]|nr:T9SS type A sorting domain-containing protein [Candidatus Latescibacterota bacterium]